MPFTPYKQEGGFKSISDVMIDNYQKEKSQEKKSLIEKIGGAGEKLAEFTGGKELAQGIGTSISNALGGQEQVQESQAGLASMQNKIVQEINRKRALGKDTTKLEDILKKSQGIMQQTAQSVEDIGTQGLNNKQVLGSAAQLAANIAATKLPSPSIIKGTGVGNALARTGMSSVQGAVSSGLSTAAKGVAEGKTPAQIKKEAKNAAIAGAVFSGAFQGGAEAYKGLGNLFGKAGEKVTMSVIKPSQADIKDGFNVANVKKYDLDGSLEQTLGKTNTKMGELSNTLKSKLEGSTEKIDLGSVYKKTVDEIQGSKLSGFGSNTKTGSALNDLNEEINLLFGKDGVNISIPDAQIVKQAAGAQGAWQFGRTDPESTAREMVYNAFYKNLKEEIENKSPAGVKEINKQLSELIPIRNAVIRRIPVAQRNNALGLGEIISIAAGVSNPSALALTGVSLASKSGRAGRALSKAGANMVSPGKVSKTVGKTVDALTAPTITALTTE